MLDSQDLTPFPPVSFARALCFQENLPVVLCLTEKGIERSMQELCSKAKNPKGSSMNETIANQEQLMDYFLNSCSAEKSLRVGAEFEKLGVHVPSGKAISYGGKEGVTAVLSGLSHRFQWEPIREGSKIIALSRGSTRITLEPGGQIELSGAPLDNVHQVKEELEDHIVEIKSVLDPLKVRWLGLGVQPTSRLDQIQWVPKERYKIMAPNMAKTGRLAHYMMKMTASIQVNLDYVDEEDFSEKMRTALALVPLVSAMFANSPISEGTLNGFLSKRSHIWHHTDATRCGLIEKKFFSRPQFSSYVDYALKVPIIFIIRDNRWIGVKDMNFSDYLRDGYQSYRATWDDWELHLSTIFTEVRVKGYVELRCTDSQRMQLAPAVVALWKGILYSKEMCRAAWSLVKNVSWEELCRLYFAVPREGLKTKLGGVSFLDLAKELLRISSSGLKQQRQLNEKGEDESIHLEPVMELIIDDEVCPAEIIIKNWEGSWHRDMSKLIDYSSY